MCVGSGKNIRGFQIHDICSENIEESMAKDLRLSHTTSQFLGYGKKTAWASWQNTQCLTETLIALTNEPQIFTLESPHMQILERFVVIMYSKDCGLVHVNEARHHLFTSGKKNIPPTQSALFQHIKRALLQASFYWNQAISCHQDIPDLVNEIGKW